MTADDPGKPVMQKSALWGPWGKPLTDCSLCSSQTVLRRKTQLTSRRLRKVSSGTFLAVREACEGSGASQPADQLMLKAYRGFPGPGLLCYSGSKSHSHSSAESTPLCVFLALNSLVSTSVSHSSCCSMQLLGKETKVPGIVPAST